jgi:hypothetical protein
MRRERNLLISAILIALSVLPRAAMAQASDCSVIRSSSQRLACYDRISPPITPSARKAKERPQTNSVDAMDAETVRMKQVLRPICRDC